MSYCFIVAGMSTRQHLLKKFIETAKTSKYKDADFYLYYQEVSEDFLDFDKAFFRKIHYSRTRDGVCLPRMYWLKKLDNYDFYIIVDDDMELRGKEDYELMMRFSEATYDCGLICGEYKSRIDLYEKAVPENKIVVKNVQFIEGGTVIKKSIRDLLVQNIPLARLSYDGFCITTFINGYTNYKCLKSVTLHKLTNGTQGFVYVRRHPEQFEEWFEKYIKRIRINGSNEMSLPSKEKDLTDEAIKLHMENKK